MMLQIHKKEAMIVIFLFLVSLLVQISYHLESGWPQRLPRGDERWYDTGGKGLKTVLQKPIALGLPLLTGQLDDQKKTELGFNNDANGFFRAPLYSTLLGFLYLFGEESFSGIYMAQIILYCLSIILIFLLGRELLNNRIGIVAAIAALLYSSFVVFTDRILTESLSIFMFLLSVYLIVKAVTLKHRTVLFLAGCSIFFLMITHAALKYIFVFFIPVVSYTLYTDKRKTRRTSILPFLLGFFSLWFGWMGLTYGITGKPLLGSYSRGGGNYFYRAFDIHSECYTIDYPGVSSTQELREGFQKKSDSKKAYFEATKLLISRYPFQCLAARITKTSHLWFYPDVKDEEKTRFFSFPRQVLYHKFIFVFGVLGFFIAMVKLNWKRVLIFFVPILYTMGIYFHLEHRHNVPTIPFIILFFSFGLSFFYHLLYKFFQRYRKDPKKRKKDRMLWLSVSAGALMLLGSQFFSTSILTTVLSPQAAYLIHRLLIVGFLLFTARVLYQFYTLEMSRRKAMWCSLLPMVLFSVSFMGTSFGNRNWHEWKATLENLNQKIRQEIHLPKNLNPSQYAEAELKIDMLGGIDKDYDVVVKVNDVVVKRFEQGLRSDSLQFRYHHYGKDIFKHAAANLNWRHKSQNYGEEYFRQWFTVPIDMSFIQASEPLMVELSLEGSVGGKRNSLCVYGDYTVKNDNTYRGPSFAFTPFETSRWKFWAFIYDREKADNRLYKEIPLKSTNTISSFSTGQAWSYEDLSNGRGRQSGAYRIRLLLKRKGGYYVRADRSGQQRVVWTVPGEGDVPVSEEYLVGRLQRNVDIYFSGYDVF